MRYNIKIMSQYEIQKKCELNKIDKCIIISINCPNNPTVLQNENIIDVLTLDFHDIECEREGLVAMNIEHGYKIKDFIDKYKSATSNIIVHCTAGISRSAGVGCAIAMYLNGTDNYLWAKGTYLPNKRCYELTLQALGITLNKKDFKRKQKLRDRASKIAHSKFCADYGINLDDMFIQN